jgi:hypothetical protein
MALTSNFSEKWILLFSNLLFAVSIVVVPIHHLRDFNSFIQHVAVVGMVYGL